MHNDSYRFHLKYNKTKTLLHVTRVKDLTASFIRERFYLYVIINRK